MIEQPPKAIKVRGRLNTNPKSITRVSP